jgi:hypothetical protein
MGIMGSLGFCDSLSHWVQPLDVEGVSAELKLHVRWCGRGDGHNPLLRPDRKNASLLARW